jgi:hypothetical protein
MNPIAYSDTLTNAQQESVRANSVDAVGAMVERLRAGRPQAEAPSEPQAPVVEQPERVAALSGIALNLMRASNNSAEQERNGKGLR